MTNFDFLKSDSHFADFVKQVEKSKAELQKGLDKLELLKKALMQKYFRRGEEFERINVRERI